ncbi:pseudouridine synthase [Rheinheimera sp. F8]|uniref:RluA family pseudouridine synthase n=1 Tax=Rheinheimera sp. F8 TaxID=1763998 RepID=UPI000744B954|nr:pseudouridine synthase [Rheinheimera sp. F8]ALZ77987.1 RNA pseudouridine synthase [Rheinheimera sp. F8]
MTDLTDLAVLPATNERWQLLYQDEDVVIVNKPARLLTVPGRHPANRDCLISRVQSEFPGAQVVHRLDYDTSGIVLLPLHKKALSELSKQFQARTIIKQYQALVAGQIAAEGDIELPIAADPDRRPLYKICAEQGKASFTHYQRLNFMPDSQISRVLLEPLTGRSHQLRLHLASVGHPILGDEFYAPTAIQQQADRLCLHACFIGFHHPRSGQWLEFSQPPAF